MHPVAVSQPRIRNAANRMRTQGSREASPNSWGTVPAARKTPKMVSATIQSTLTMTQPSSSPCSAPTSRHHSMILFSSGIDSPIAVPIAAGISSACDRTAARVVCDHGFGSGPPTSSASLVRALSMSACWAPDGPAAMLLSSAHSLPSRIRRTGSRPVSRSTNQAIGQPT